MTRIETHPLRRAGVLFAVALLLAMLCGRHAWSPRAAEALAGVGPDGSVEQSLQRKEPSAALAQREAPAPRTLFGLVQATTGAPISGAAVCALAKRALVANLRRCSTSDRSGRFKLEAVQSGEIALSASARGFVAQTQSLPTAAGDGAPVTLTLRPGGATLAGTVSDALGGGVAGALLVARDDASRIITALETGAGGEFDFEVEPGPVTLEASAAAYSRDALSVTAPASALSIVLTPASTLLGRVEANGVPVTGARVVAAPADGPVIGAREASSDASGAFELAELPPGRYQLIASHADQRSKPVWVELVVGQPSAATLLSLERAASLVASVHVRGQPCREGRVSLNGPELRSEPIDDSGVAHLDGVSAGSYELEVLCDAAAPHRESLEVGPGVTKRDFDLDSGRELRGRVEDASGRAVAGAWLTLEASAPATAGASASSDATGEFTCRGLAASEYDVSARSPLGVLSEKKHVDLTNVQVARLVLRLADLASIHVTLSGADAPHSTQVFAQPKDGLIVPAQRRGDELVFDRLPLGEYRVFTGGSAEPGESSALVSLKRDGEIARITLSAPKLASIQGVVLDAAGDPVIDAWVRAANSNALLGLYADTPNAAITDDRGQFRLAGLFPGLYDLCTSCDTDNQRVTAIEAGATNVVLRVAAEMPKHDGPTAK